MELIEKKAREALNKFKARIQELTQLVEAGEVSNGYKRKKLYDAALCCERVIKYTQNKETAREWDEIAKVVNAEIGAFEDSEARIGDRATKQRIAREGIEELGKIFQIINNKERSGKLSKAQAQKMRREHMRSLDFDPGTLKLDDPHRQQLDQWRDLIEEGRTG